MKGKLIAVLMAAAIAGIGQAWGQAPPPPDQGFPGPGGPQQDGAADQGDHGVARLSLMQGEVSVRHGDAGDLTAAAPNAPVLALDRVVTGANSRAELQFDATDLIRLSSSSEVRLGDLQYKRYLVQIAQGLATFRALRASDAQVEISTPSISVRPVGQGTIRVMVSPDGTTEITVRNGEAEAFSPKGSEELHAGQTLLARGDPSDPEFQINAAISTDDFDRWNAQRDGELQRYTTSSRNVNPDIYGTEDLDQNGRWVNDPSYGQVWVPAVDAGWAPYRVGRWVWEDYYGWVWVSGDPWGWAPYHWGRWYVGSYGWAWWPGAGFGPRAYWSPALVGFFGWGGGVGIGVGFGFGNVGWVPLGPYEAFRPWYGRGLGGVNIVNNVNVANSYRNARFVNGMNGVTSMRAGEFGRGAVNGGSFVRASAVDLRGAGSIQGRMPVTPGAASMRLSDRAVNTAGMPATNANMRFAGRSSFGSSSGGPVNTGGSANGGWSRMSPNGAGRTAGPGGNAGGPAAQNANRGAGYAGNAGGWRSFNPGTGNGNAGAVTPRGGATAGGSGTAAARTYAGGSQTGYSPRGGAPGGARGGDGYSRGATPQQPVRISPPIVSNRGASGGGPAPRGADVHSGFGGAHSSGGGNRGGGGGGGHRGR